tara:strand:+ start:881 stop:1429 length:549 start_codon:yes stop_codon:yes gene_type:complete
MSCDISAGRTEPCKDAVGGIKNLYFVNFEDIVEPYTYDATNTDVIDGFGSAASIVGYKYELKGGNNLEQSINSSRENGTTFTEQTLTAVLKKQDIATHKQIKFLSYGRPRVVIEDYNGNFFLMGKEHGAEVTTVAVSTGTAMGDLSGYTITMVAQEKIPANFIDATETTIASTPFFTSVVTS